MNNALRSIALGCAAVFGAVTVSTIAMPSAQAHDRDGYHSHRGHDRGWRGDRGHHRGWRGDRYHGRGHYYGRGGGPVYVAPPRVYRPVPARPVFVRPVRPGVSVHFGR